MVFNGLLISYLILNGLKSLVYIFIIILALRRLLKDRSSPALWLLLYAGLAFAMHTFQLAADWGFFPGLNMAVRLRMDEYTALLLSLVLYQSLRIFLGKERQFALF